MKDIVLTEEEYNKLKATREYIICEGIKTGVISNNDREGKISCSLSKIGVLENKTEKELSKINYIRITKENEEYTTVYKAFKLIKDHLKIEKMEKFLKLSCYVLAAIIILIFKQNSISETFIYILFVGYFFSLCISIPFNIIYDIYTEKIYNYRYTNLKDLNNIKTKINKDNLITISLYLSFIPIFIYILIFS